MNDPLRDAAGRLRAAGVESPRVDARLLWERAQNVGPAAFEELVQRRLRHEPAAYIIGHREFWSLDFEVGSGALIPRPETETLIEESFRALPDRNGDYRFLDLGTGTGCLLIALLKEFPNATGVGIDLSEAALKWARRNVVRHRLDSRCSFVVGNWDAAEGCFDLIVSNPPYIATPDLSVLPAEIRDYEPAAALDGGADGLDAYRALSPVLIKNLKSSGFALLEIGAGQHHLVAEVVEAQGLRVLRVAADFSGFGRCLVIIRPVANDLGKKKVGNPEGTG